MLARTKGEMQAPPASAAAAAAAAACRPAPLLLPSSHAAAGLLSPLSPAPGALFELELDGASRSAAAAAAPAGPGVLPWPAGRAGGASGAQDGPTAAQRLLTLCCDASPLASQLLQDLSTLREAYAPAPSRRLPAFPLSSDSEGAPADDAPCGADPDAATAGSSPRSASSLGSSPGGRSGASGGLFGSGPGSAVASAPLRGDVEAIACELLAAGYLVQVRDEAGGGAAGAAAAAAAAARRDARRCLQQLRHRFIVCVGAASAAAAAAVSASASAHPVGAAAGGDGGGVLDAAGCGCGLLPEPLVVEPHFREQFVIAHPTPAYEELLQAVPHCFVGTVARLEAAVSLLCEEMAAAFKTQGLPVPPWRSKRAMLSKWAPQQLSSLAAKIATVRGSSSGGGAEAAASASASASAAAFEPSSRPCGGAAAAAAPLSAAPARVALPHHTAGAIGFTRKASLEWKGQTPASGKKVRSLLAAALRETSVSSPRGDAAGGAGNAGADAPAAAGGEAPRGAPAGGSPAGGSPAIRTTPNQPGWGCITTVRWGAALETPAPPAPASAQQPQPQPLHGGSRLGPRHHAARARA
ncbi:hypothetical protein Rsub_08575 [Raphidocelis subcapitata]|uniref:Uncharacterized protein n=1 Tax=Raphidocelis subcapitata TaxID=307507 RepID=A0A2V0P6U5_9CHLO|nr:hypothetical protein Rsub_08575 [Raphidocelis subcapitata]|eukprot:GBF95594.1 hypothetical protein Rsub_08575 [Raphidocelis subcapitata]